MKKIVKVFWKDPDDRRVEVNYESEPLSEDIDVWREGDHVLYFHKQCCVALYELRYTDAVIPMAYFFSEVHENCYVQDHGFQHMLDSETKKIRAMIDSSLAKLIVT